MPDKLAPPRHLSREARAWWHQVVTAYELQPHHLHILRLACESWDRGQAARVALAQQGTVYVDRFGQPRARPEVGIERDARLAFARLNRELNLDAAGEPGRPPLIHGRYVGRP